MESFEKRVKKFMDEVSVFVSKKEDRDTVVREIVKLVMQVQSGMGSTDLRRLAFRLNILDDFTFFKNQYLDVSQYVHRKLWVAVTNNVQSAEIPSDPMLVSDVAFCLSVLNEGDIQKVRNIRINQDLNVDGIDLATFTTGKKKKKELIPYVKSKAYTLSFLSEYDPGFGSEDFEQDLVTEAVRVFNNYPRSKGKSLHKEHKDLDGKPKSITPIQERVEKYIETALNNKVMNLKEYYTCENRRRVSTTDNGAYKKKNKLKKLLQKHPIYLKNKAALEQFESEIDNLDEKLGMLKIVRDGGALKLAASINAVKRQKELIVEGKVQLRAKMTQIMDMMLEDETYRVLREQLLEVETHIKNSDSDYYSLVTPLVRHDEGEDRVIDIGDDNNAVAGDDHESKFMVESAKSLDDRLWLEGICDEVDPNVATFVRIVSGDHIPDFETWAKSEGIDTNIFDALVNGAKRYCNVNKSQLVANPVLREALGRL